jgi:uncharacterized delta-60 repeat protein
MNSTAVIQICCSRPACRIALVVGGLLAAFNSTTLQVAAAPPRIDYQPSDQTVVLYQQAAFGVIVSGTGPLSYQWCKDGRPILGATDDQFVVAAARFADAGRYSVVVSNSEGSEATTNAVLAVMALKAGDVDCSFTPGAFLGTDSRSVQSVATQPNGKTLIAGDAVRGGIRRLNPDGSTDHTFLNGLSGADHWVAAAAVQGDGQILIGGWFSQVNGVVRNAIARLNPDGSVDHSFLNGLAGLSDSYDGWSLLPFVLSVTLQADNKVLIAGRFSAVNGISRHNVARLNVDGTVDTAFADATFRYQSLEFGGVEDMPFVLSAAVQPDGKIIVGGAFTTVNGISRPNIARLNRDGTVDVSFHSELSGDLNSRVTSIALQGDGKILITSGFANYNASVRLGARIARLNPDGSLDNTFQSQVGGSVVALDNQGRVLTAGRLVDAEGADRYGIVRLNTDGIPDAAFQPAMLDDSGRWVSCIAVQTDGVVVIGGAFNSINGVGRGQIARLGENGALDAGFQAENLSGDQLTGDLEVTALRVQGDGKVLVGGLFSTFGGVRRSNVARLNSDGTLDGSFLNGLSGVGNEEFDWQRLPVQCLALQSDGKVLVGGHFRTVNGVARTNLARLNVDGTLDRGFVRGLAVEGRLEEVVTLAPLSDGKVLLSAVQHGGRVAPNVSVFTRLNADGSLDNRFPRADFGYAGDYFNLGIWSTVVQGDGKLLIGGGFDEIQGESRNCIARLNSDGTLDREFLAGLVGIESAWLPPSVTSIVVEESGKILIGGSFNRVHGVDRNNIARLNSDGSLDRGFLDGLNGAVGLDSYALVKAIAVQTDGKVLIGGSFTIVNGAVRTNLARLNPDGTLDTNFLGNVSGPDGNVDTILVDSLGGVLIGGRFTQVNGIPAPGIARLWGTADIRPRITKLDRNGSAVHVSWDALPDRSYRLQYKNDPSERDWVDVAGDVTGTPLGTASKSDTPDRNRSSRYYRTVLLPGPN